MHVRIALVKLSNCCVGRSQTIPRLTIKMDDRSVERVYHIDIHSIDEMKQRLIQDRCNLHQDIVDMATDQWCKRFPACVHAKDAHFKHTI